MLLFLPDAANLIRTATISPPTTGGAASVPALQDGAIGRRWAATVVWTSHVLTATFAGGAVKRVSFVALLDVRVSGAATVDVEYFEGGVWKPAALGVALLPRRNGYARFAPVMTSSVRVTVKPVPGSILQVGELVAGDPVVAPDPKTVDFQDQHFTVQNGEVAAKVAEARMRLDLRFAPAAADPLATVLESAAGAWKPVVLALDNGVQNLVLHGRLSDESPLSMDPTLLIARRLAFLESRRGLT